MPTATDTTISNRVSTAASEMGVHYDNIVIITTNPPAHSNKNCTFSDSLVEAKRICCMSSGEGGGGGDGMRLERYDKISIFHIVELIISR